MAQQDPVLATPIMGCTLGDTVRAVEAFITTTCASGNNCHRTTAQYPPDLEKSPIYPRLANISSTTYCKTPPTPAGTGKLIDREMPLTRSLLLSKIREAMPTCPVGAEVKAGAQMPYGMAPLTADQIHCLEEYATVVAATAK